MIITPLGFVFTALFVLLLVGGRSTFVWAIAVSMFFQDSAMVVVDGVGIAPYTVSLMIALALQIVFVIRSRRLHRRESRPVGLLEARTSLGRWLRRALVVLLVYGVLISAIGPWLFKGVKVMPSQGSYDFLVDHLPALSYSLSNLAQIAYLILSAVLVWFVATLPRVPRAAFFAAVISAIAIVLIAIVLAAVKAPWPFAFFDNSPRNYYAVLADDPRLRAQFSEPSHLALFLTMALVYATRLLPLPPLWRRLVAAAVVAVSLVAFLQNPSTTIILAMAVIVPAALAVLAVRYRTILTSRRGLAGIGAGVVVLGLAGALCWKPLADFLGPALLGKIGGSSQYSRGKQDLNALSLLGQTFGLGAGLGSNRSSSLATMLLSDIGVIGTVAYYVVIVASIAILFTRRHSAEGWALTALAVACAISVADFVSPPTWFLIGVAAQLSRPSASYGGAHRLPVLPRRIPALTGVGR
jgi:hypothetical protein